MSAERITLERARLDDRGHFVFVFKKGGLYSMGTIDAGMVKAASEGKIDPVTLMKALAREIGLCVRSIQETKEESILHVGARAWLKNDSSKRLRTVTRVERGEQTVELDGDGIPTHVSELDRDWA